MSKATSSNTLREIDERNTDGLNVRLLWHPKEKTVVLRVVDHGLRYEDVVVAPEQARDAFIHPFVYVADEIDETPAEAEKAPTGGK